VIPGSDAMSDIDAPSYLIVIERADDGGYGAWAPDLPGCVALGGSVEECEHEMREASLSTLRDYATRASRYHHPPPSPR